MAYNIELKHKTIGGSNNIFDSSQVRWVTGGVTIDAETVAAVDGEKVLKIGQPLGKITATGKYGPYAPAITGVKASSTTTVDKIVAKFEGEKSEAYNGVVIKFVTGAEAAAVWSAKELTLTLVAVTSYGKTELETLIAAATTGAPAGVDVEKIVVTIASSKTGTNWAAATAVTLDGGAADIAAADDGRQTAVLMLGEDVYLEDGDQVCTAFDMARVLSARLPVTVTAELKAHLPNITFVG